MVMFRIPGPQCPVSGPFDIDDGTLALSRMLPPAPLCGDLLFGAGSTMAGSTPLFGRQSWRSWPTGGGMGGSGGSGGAPAASSTGSGSGPAPGSTTPSATTPAAPPPLTAIDNDTRMLAATAYGEGSSKDVFEEMAAIANVLVRQRQARGYGGDAAFIQADKTFAFAAHDGNQRYAKLMEATIDQINADAGMLAAVRGAINARSETPTDYANGAYFWDGADIKTNYDKHAKVLGGIQITDPKHNIYGIKSKAVPGEAFWFDAKGNKGKSRGKWQYKYDSTAAWGGTIFWKYNADFLKASGNKAHK